MGTPLLNKDSRLFVSTTKTGAKTEVDLIEEAGASHSRDEGEERFVFGRDVPLTLPGELDSTYELSGILSLDDVGQIALVDAIRGNTKVWLFVVHDDTDTVEKGYLQQCDVLSHEDSRTRADNWAEVSFSLRGIVGTFETFSAGFPAP